MLPGRARAKPPRTKKLQVVGLGAQSARGIGGERGGAEPTLTSRSAGSLATSHTTARKKRHREARGQRALVLSHLLAMHFLLTAAASNAFDSRGRKNSASGRRGPHLQRKELTPRRGGNPKCDSTPLRKQWHAHADPRAAKVWKAFFAQRARIKYLHRDPQVKSSHWGLSPGHPVYRTDALPLSYRGPRAHQPAAMDGPIGSPWGAAGLRVQWPGRPYGGELLHASPAKYCKRSGAVASVLVS